MAAITFVKAINEQTKKQLLYTKAEKETERLICKRYVELAKIGNDCEINV